jgi:hypothetical protein
MGENDMCELRDHANLRNKMTSRGFRGYERNALEQPRSRNSGTRYYIGRNVQQGRQGINVSRRIVGRTHIINGT